MYFSIGNIITQLKVTQFFFFIHSFGSKSRLYSSKLTGAHEGGLGAGPPLRVPPPWGGGAGMEGSFNITSVCISLPQAIYIEHSTLHCIALTQTKRLRKEINYVLIHNNTLQSLVWSSVALIIHVFSLLQKRWRNVGFKGTSDLTLYKFKVTWNYAYIPLSIITSSNKNTFKSHNCP